MKKILLLQLVFFIVHCSAQKQLTDSLINAVNNHPQQDTIRATLFISISSAFFNTDTTKCFQYADSAILLAKKLNNSLKLADSYNNKAMKYILAERIQTAIVYKNLYLQQLLFLHDSVKIIECYNHLSSLY